MVFVNTLQRMLKLDLILQIMNNIDDYLKEKIFNLINRQWDIDKIYLYTKDTYEVKYLIFINKTESTGLKHYNNSKAFIEYSNDMDDIHKNFEE